MGPQGTQLAVAVASALLFFSAAWLTSLVAGPFFTRLSHVFRPGLRWMDDWLARTAAGWAGLDVGHPMLRWTRLIGTFFALAVAGAFLPVWPALLAMAAGLAFVIAIFRRWSWDEEDRAADLPVRRIPGDEDYNDELLAALAAVFMFGSLLTWRLGSAFGLFTDPQAAGLTGYVVYVAGETLESVPILGNIDVMGWRNPSGLEVAPPGGGRFAFVLRTVLDILVIGGLLKTLEIAGRINRGEDLRRLEIATRSTVRQKADEAVKALEEMTQRGSNKALQLLGRIAVVPASGDPAPLGNRWDSAAALYRLGSRETGTASLAVAAEGFREVAAELRLNPESGWLPNALQWVGVASDALGMRIGGRSGFELLQESARAHRESLVLWEASEAPVRALEARRHLSSVLLRLGQRSPPGTATAIFRESLLMSRAWLDGLGPTSSPFQRANIGNNAGVALERLSRGLHPAQAALLLDESISVLQACLAEPFDDAALRSNLEQSLGVSREQRAFLTSGADTQSLQASVDQAEVRLQAAPEGALKASAALSLGVSLVKLANVLPIEAATDLYQRSADEIRRSVAFRQAVKDRDEWSHGLSCLGVSLDNHARRLGPSEAEPVWREAIAAFSDALRLLSDGSRRTDAASTLHHLMTACTDAADAVGGPDVHGWRMRAVEAGREALFERSRGEERRHWAFTSKYFSVALDRLAYMSGTPERIGLLRDAVHATQDALTVLRPETDFSDWRQCQNNLAVWLQSIGDLVSGDEKVEWFGRAVNARRDFLEQQDRLTPQEAASASVDLGISLDRLGDVVGWPLCADYQSEAVNRFSGALAVLTHEEHPGEHLRTTYSLAFSSARLATSNPDWIDGARLREASAIYERRHELAPDPNHEAERKWFDDWLAEAGPDPAPLDACPCGSGAAYGDCHGRNLQ